MSGAHAASRRRSLAWALTTIVVGLLVHRAGGGLSVLVRDVLGDALWGAMMFWWVGVVVPHLRITWRAAIAAGICVAVECSQLIQVPWLDAIRATTPGHLVLGSDYDSRDLLAYAMGILAAVGLERVLRRYRTRMLSRPAGLSR